MNKKNYLIFFIFCICTHSFATKVSKPFLYEVQKDGKTSYILGSIHIGIGVSDLPPWVNELHKRAKTHSYEIDFGAGESIEDFKFMQNLFLFKNSDISISPYVPETEQDPIPLNDAEIERLVEIGFPKYFAENADVETSCSALFFFDQIFSAAYKSMDYEFYNNSILMGKKIVALEDDLLREEADELIEPDEECLLKDIIWEEDILNLVRQSMSEGKIFESYISGSEEEKYPDENEVDVFYRNKKWIPKLKNMFNEGDAFAVFGTIHLFGNQGIIKLLENEGFKVRRVTKDPLHGTKAIPPELRPYR